MKKIKINDFSGGYNLNLKKDTVEFKQFFKEIDGVIWMFRKIGKLDWEAIETPLKQVPHVEFGITNPI